MVQGKTHTLNMLTDSLLSGWIKVSAAKNQRENLLLNERVIKCMFWELQVVQPQPLLPQILTYHCSKFNSSIHKQTTQRLRFSKRLIRRCDFAQPLSGLQRFIQVVFFCFLLLHWMEICYF